jgi:hypothetical protein
MGDNGHCNFGEVFFFVGHGGILPQSRWRRFPANQKHRDVHPGVCSLLLPLLILPIQKTLPFFFLFDGFRLLQAFPCAVLDSGQVFANRRFSENEKMFVHDYNTFANYGLAEG